MSGRLFRRFWAWPWELRRRGALGVNRRQATYTLRLNRREMVRQVDDKARTKAICQANGIPVPETYALFERPREARSFPEALGGRTEFVIKPARGAGGRGALVITGMEGGLFRTARGDLLSVEDVRTRLWEILSGGMSRGEWPDRAIVEKRLRRHPAFDSLCRCGAPDVRVLVWRGAPVMAMLRLPTRQSGGRSNLHQGGVGVGVDMATGVTRGGVRRGRSVERAPDTAARIEGVQLPDWPETLDMAARLARALEMGYVGVDIVPDADQGPVVLEANAHPGLGIQIANMEGIVEAIDAVEARGT